MEFYSKKQAADVLGVGYSALQRAINEELIADGSVTCGKRTALTKEDLEQIRKSVWFQLYRGRNRKKKKQA